jgi:hypothetical protein
MIALPTLKIVLLIVLPGMAALALGAVNVARDDDETAGFRTVGTLIALLLIPTVLVGFAYLVGLIEVSP